MAGDSSGLEVRPGTLRDQQRQVTLDALVRAARRGLSEYGLDVTVDHIAALAQVGRRTVFRHFATRDDLLQAAIAAIAEDYLRALQGYGAADDWQHWLTDLTSRAHQVAADAGRLLWELRTRHLPPRLQAASTEHQRLLDQRCMAIAAGVWEAAGGHGALPERLRQTVAIHLSPLFTHIVLHEARGTPKLAAELSVTAIVSTVRDLCTEAPA